MPLFHHPVTCKCCCIFGTCTLRKVVGAGFGRGRWMLYTHGRKEGLGRCNQQQRILHDPFSSQGCKVQEQVAVMFACFGCSVLTSQA